MTVIVWDGKTLAADRMLNHQGMATRTEKIMRRGEFLVAVGGNDGLARAMAEHLFGDGTVPWPIAKDHESASLVVVHSSGKIVMYEDERPFPVPVAAHRMAWGAGRDFAMAAMAMGADACRAVEVACELSTVCGLGVQIEVPGALAQSTPAGLNRARIDDPGTAATDVEAVKHVQA